MAQYGLDTSCHAAVADVNRVHTGGRPKIAPVQQEVSQLQKSIKKRDKDLEAIKADLRRSLDKQQELKDELHTIKVIMVLFGVIVAICFVMYPSSSHNSINDKAQENSQNDNYDVVLRKLTEFMDRKYGNMPKTITALQETLSTLTITKEVPVEVKVNVTKPCECNATDTIKPEKPEKPEKPKKIAVDTKQLDVSLSKEMKGISKEKFDQILNYFAEQMVEIVFNGVQSRNIVFTQGKSDKVVIRDNIYENINESVAAKGYTFDESTEILLRLEAIDINTMFKTKMTDNGKKVDLMANVMIKSVSIY